jgi:hypothetical protein
MLRFLRSLRLKWIHRENRPGALKTVAGKSLAVSFFLIPASDCVELAKGFEPPTL